MATPKHPKRGSMAYTPRKRAKKHTPRFRSWPEIDAETPRVQGFAGYKAGMTHVIAVESNKNKTTKGQEIQVPVTVVEVPPMRVLGARFYVKSYEGLKALTEIWAPTNKLGKYIDKKIVPPKTSSNKDKWEAVKSAIIEDVRLITATQPELISGIPKKKPDIVELRVAGGTMDARLDYAKQLLGKDLGIDQFATNGYVIDVAAVTKGKGLQGPVKRWGVKLLFHKDSKGRRKVGSEGAWRPHWTERTVPQAGQMGYHHRVEFNKVILYIGKEGGEVTPRGGFLHYGNVKNAFVLIKGSVPGTTKRVIGMRDPIRNHAEASKPIEISYISTESKQGV